VIFRRCIDDHLGPEPTGCESPVLVLGWGLADPRFGRVWGWLWLVGAAVSLAGVVRLLRVRVRADDDGLRLVGWARSRRVPWNDVAGFAVVPCRVWGWEAVVVRRGGGRLSLPGLRSRVWQRRVIDRKAAEIEEVLEDRRALLRAQRQEGGDDIR
jgi:hypothetical protein